MKRLISRRNVSRLLQTLVVAACAAGYALQMSGVFCSYFSFETATTIHFESETPDSAAASVIPAISVCVHFFNKESVGTLLDLSNLRKRDGNITLSTSPGDGNSSSFLLPFTVVYYRMGVLICRSVRLQKEITQIERQLLLTSPVTLRFPDASFGQTAYAHPEVAREFVTIALHDDRQATYDVLAGDFDAGYILTVNSSFEISYQPRSVKRSLLPPPFDTRCRAPVTEERQQPATRCFPSCYLRHTGRWPSIAPLLVASNSNDPKPPGGFQLLSSPEAEGHICYGLCYPTCEERLITFREEQTLAREDGGKVIHVSPIRSKIEIESEPRIRLTDCILLSLYSAAFWFAFSPASLLTSDWLLRTCCPPLLPP